jgi:hypothetical protein
MGIFHIPVNAKVRHIPARLWRQIAQESKGRDGTIY